MALEHAKNAKKSMIKAVPTVDESGVCRGWEIEVTYALNGYKSTYRTNLDDGELDDKVPELFSIGELLDLCPVARWNMIYDSQYESVMNAPPAPMRTKLEGFDTKMLKADVV